MPKPPSETGFKVDVSDLLRTGWYPDRFSRDAPFWSDTDGLDFTNHGFERRSGASSIVDLSAENIRGITTGTEFDTKVIYAGDLTSLWAYRQDTGLAVDVGSTYALVESGGSTSWDSGTTTWDSGNTVWDDGLVEPSLWDFANFGDWVIATNGNDEPQIKKSNVTFSDLISGTVSGGSVNAAGSGQAESDDITFTGGSGTGLLVTVTGVNGGGVTSFEITDYGSGYTDGDTLTQATTTGSGTGFTLDVTVSDSPYTTAYALAQLGPHVLMFNLSTSTQDRPYDYAWCDEDNPDVWVAAAANAAGSLTIREATTDIRCAVPLGRGIAVYTTDQMFIVSYLGAPFYFGHVAALTHGVGAVSKQSVVSVGNINYGLSKEGFFLTDGSTAQAIGETQGVDDYVRDKIAQSEYSKVNAWHNKERNEVVWNLPLGSTSMTTEVYYNYETGVWGKRTSTLSFGISSGVFDYPIVGNNTGELYFANTGNNAFDVVGTTTAHDLGDADAIKELTSIRVGKLGAGMPTVRVGWSDSSNGTPTYVNTFTVDNTFVEHNLRTAGRYLFLEFTSSGADFWEITDLVVQGRTAGTR